MYRKLSLLFGMLFCSLSLHAVQVGGLYQSVIPLTSQLPDERAQAFSDALGHVLIKVSGERKVLESPAIRKQMLSAEKYVQQFGYSSQESEEFPFLLKVTFLEKSVRTLLTNNGLPIWGANRPSVLFWLAVEGEGSRRVVNGSSDSNLVGAIESQAEYYGLPLYLPVMDLQDEAALSVGDLWGLFMGPVMQASQRYNPDAVAAMQLYQSALGEWKGRWTLNMRGNSISSPVVGDTPEKAIANAVKNVTEILAKQYSVVGQSVALDDYFELEVSNIERYDDFVDLYEYIESLSPVVSTQVSWVKEDKVRLRIKISGDLGKFEQHVLLNKKLEANISGVGTVTDTFRLYYRWQG